MASLDFKHPGAKEVLVVAGPILLLGALYVWWKRKQAANTAAASTASGSTSPTAVFTAWIHDHNGTNNGTVTVPNVVGKGDTAADTAITGAGFKIGDTNEPKGGFGKNQGSMVVTSQNPSGGSLANPGSTVSLTFGKKS